MSEPIVVYVPRDSTALAVGADAVADAIARTALERGSAIRIVRNSSRGLFWLEPLVEIATPQGRLGFGPVAPDDVAVLFDAGFPDAPIANGTAIGGCTAIGRVDDHPYLASQQRLTFARIGLTDPLSLDDYLAHEGYAGLHNALQQSPAKLVAEVVDSGLRGRGPSQPLGYGLALGA